MATLHDDDVRRRDAPAGPAEHEIDALIPDLTDVDIHEHFPELRTPPGPVPPRASRRGRWLGWVAAYVVLAVAATMLIGDRGEDAAVIPTDGPWSNSLDLPATGGPRPWDAPWSNSQNFVPPGSAVVGVSAAQFATLESAVVPAPAAVRDLPGSTSLDVPAIPLNVHEFAAAEDAVTPADGPAGVSVGEFAAAEDAVAPRPSGAPTESDGPGSNSLELP